MDWIFLYVLSSSALVTVSVYGNECDTGPVKECYEHLVHFEGPAFPFYGANEAELDQTCKAMNSTFECIGDFLSLCNGHPDCDAECRDEVSRMNSVTENSGLPSLYSEICEPGKLLRQTYLDNYQCIENAEDKYQRCYNMSQISLKYIRDVEDPDKEIMAKCCFFTWYPHCYTDATMNQCSLNATFFVSYSLHILLGVTKKLCVTEVKCSEPPLSDDSWPIDDSDVKKITDIVDNNINGAKKSTDIIDNSIDIGEELDSSFAWTLQTYPLNFIISVLFVVLSKFVLT